MSVHSCYAVNLIKTICFLTSQNSKPLCILDFTNCESTVVDPNKSKQHMFVYLTKLKTVMYFKPCQLQIVLLVDPTKRRKKFVC